jgi:hypothetical protein
MNPFITLLENLNKSRTSANNVSLIKQHIVCKHSSYYRAFTTALSFILTVKMGEK